jgi:2-aminoethylphosphonate--pyruvate transaminase/phosphonoacetaldehyde hydrolase
MKILKLVVFDLAGTTVDFGSLAPMAAFERAFSEHGVSVSHDEIRPFMGLHKRDHIRNMLSTAAIAERWRSVHGSAWTDADLEALYRSFLPLQLAVLPDHGAIVPGLLEVVLAIRQRGLRIAATTGYFAEATRLVLNLAANQGFVPDCARGADDVKAGRPAPWMMFSIMEQLQVYPPAAVIKVGDTLADIQEGLAAGAWSLGVTSTSSECGCSEREFEALKDDERRSRLAAVRRKFIDAGAHAVIDTLTELPALLDKLDATMGEAGRTGGTSSLGFRTSSFDLRSSNEGRSSKLEVPSLLLTPGPLTTSLTVKRAMLRDSCTWDADYNGLVSDLRRRLVALATRTQTYTTVLMQGSGSFAIEATLGSVIARGGKVLIATNGAYGDRMVQIADRLGIARDVAEFPETEPVAPGVVEKRLAQDPTLTHVALVHCETTTGLLNPAAEVGQVVRRFGKTYIVDAMSSFAGLPFTLEDLGAHFVVTSANKCLQGVPGFGIIFADRESLSAARGRARSVCLDLYDQWREMEEKGGKWRFTSPTHTVLALARALDELEEEGGIVQRHRRYQANHKALLEGMPALGFRPLLPPGYQSPIITSFLYADDPAFTFEGFYEGLKKRGFTIYPGKISKAKTFRIGTIGHVFPGDITRLLAAIADMNGGR